MDSVKATGPSSDVKLIAYYLPQFHPIQENDEWWGKGFTEWSNVARGAPAYPGHVQPRQPADLGFYDLRLPEVRRAQVKLARANGIHGFCYYYYWFNGRRLLERPLDDMLASTDADFPFCICWANENWTRRWDGAEREVLMQQVHSPESDARFIRDVLPILKDRRYIRVNGAPMLMVYRPQLLPDSAATVDRWRRIAREEGVPQLHLTAVQSFGLTDPRPFGFDAAVEFPPHGLKAEQIESKVSGLRPDFTGHIFDYREVVQTASRRPTPDYPAYRGVMTSWDNTARTGPRAHIFHNATPELYESWLRAAVDDARDTLPEEQRFVFINAWNEWAEGAYLEPDKQWGHAYLHATRRALLGRVPWRNALEALRTQADLPPAEKARYLDSLAHTIEGYARSTEYLLKSQRLVEQLVRSTETVEFTTEIPRVLQEKPVANEGRIGIDQVDTHAFPQSAVLHRERPNYVRGWGFSDAISLTDGRVATFLVLRARGGEQLFFAPVFQRVRRDDVARAFPDREGASIGQSGFALSVRVDQVPPGHYELGVIHAGSEQVACVFERESVTVK